MAQRPSQENPEELRRRLVVLLSGFESELAHGDLRQKVLALIPAVHLLRKLGRSLTADECSGAARDRLLFYFQRYPQTVISGDELLVVSGIQEYARRLRELRVEFGWAIVSGVAVREMASEDAEVPAELCKMRPSDYILLRTAQDRDAAHRWNLANSIRRRSVSVRDKLLEFFRTNVGKSILNEELRYVAGNRTEWARRVRELRTEFGWPIATKTTGRPDLDVGVYVLQADRQSPQHDRKIPDPVRCAAMRRDNYQCTNCGWKHAEWNPSDPRHLELHHIRHHARGGPTELGNLRTVCTVCHDDIHRREGRG